MNRYIIIGAGIAGTEAAAAVLERDVEARVDLFNAEPDLPYYRPQLTPRDCIFIPKQPLNRSTLSKNGFSPPGKFTLTIN